MSLNKITSDTPIKQWMNIGCNSLKATSIEGAQFIGDIIPLIDNSYELGSHAKNWKEVYSRAVKDLNQPVDGQDAINYVSAQILTTKNSGIQAQGADGVFNFVAQAPTTEELVIGGYGSAGLVGLASLPALNNSIYSFEYNTTVSGMAALGTFVGVLKIYLGSGITPVATTPLSMAGQSNGQPLNISGTLQIVSGLGTNATVVNTTLKAYWINAGTSIFTNKSDTYLTADTSTNTYFKIAIEASNTGGGTTLTRTIGYVTNVYYPSAFP